MNNDLAIPDLRKHIYHFRGKAVMLDADLAELYQVPTGRLNEAVKRNCKRFPTDFMFQLTLHEFNHLISQFAISSSGHGGRRKLPMVFTEQGVAMLSGILSSDRAIIANIQIMRAFVALRRASVTYIELKRAIDRVWQELGRHDRKFVEIYRQLERLLNPPIEPIKSRKMGFRQEN